MITNNFIFDWNSFWINIIAGLVFFSLSIIVSTWLIPKFTVKLIKKKNRKYLSTKIGAVLQELCEFLTTSQFRNEILYYEHISITTRISDIKNYKFIALSPINVLSPLVYTKMTLVIYDYFKDKDPNISYSLISNEYNRLKIFRLEIERIITVHSLHIDDEILEKISSLCFDIKALELRYQDNIVYDKLLKETGEERTGIFGLIELPKIYESILLLIKELINLEYFEFEVCRNENNR